MLEDCAALRSLPSPTVPRKHNSSFPEGDEQAWYRRCQKSRLVPQIPTRSGKLSAYLYTQRYLTRELTPVQVTRWKGAKTPNPITAMPRTGSNKAAKNPVAQPNPRQKPEAVSNQQSTGHEQTLLLPGPPAGGGFGCMTPACPRTCRASGRPLGTDAEPSRTPLKLGRLGAFLLFTFQFYCLYPAMLSPINGPGAHPHLLNPPQRQNMGAEG